MAFQKEFPGPETAKAEEQPAPEEAIDEDAEVEAEEEYQEPEIPEITNLEEKAEDTVESTPSESIEGNDSKSNEKEAIALDTEKIEEEEVPSLVIDGVTLNQSVAIMEYLEETRTDIPLLPKEPEKRALVRQIVQTIASDTQPIQNLRVLKKVGDDKKQEWAKYWIEFGFKGLSLIPFGVLM